MFTSDQLNSHLVDMRLWRAQYLVAGILQGISNTVSGIASNDPFTRGIEKLQEHHGTEMHKLCGTLQVLMQDRPKKIYYLVGPYLQQPIATPQEPPPVELPKPPPLVSGHDEQNPEPEADDKRPTEPPPRGGGRDGGTPPPVFTCPRISVRPVLLKVSRATPPAALADDVALTMAGAQAAGNSGSGIPTAQSRWPNAGQGDSVAVANGKSTHPGASIAFQAVRTDGNRCYVDLFASINLWEVDSGQINQGLKKAAQELKGFGASLGAAANPLAGAAIGAVQDSGLVEAILNKILDLIGLGDDWMGSMNFRASGYIDSTTPIKNLAWTPEPGIPSSPIKYDFVSDRTAELTQDFAANRGLWKLTTHVVRIP